MKKILLLLVVLTLAFSVVPVSAFTYETLSIEINGEEVYIPAEYGAIMIVNDRTMVPVRFVSEFLNFSVYWLDSDQMVMFANYRHIIVFQIGGQLLFVDGNVVEMDTPAMMYDNRSYIPIRVFAETVGFYVDWCEYNRTVFLDRL